MVTLVHPYPGQVLNTRRVIASVIYREDQITGEEEWTVILLNDDPPYFTVAILGDNGFAGYEIQNSKDVFNIVEAVRIYEQWGGDF